MTRHPPPATHHGFFVTGTDTGVGKTLVACALLHAFAARGNTTVGMKPVASGAEWRAGVLVNDDVERLVAAGNVDAPREHVNPYCFEPPIAPHIAAERAGASIALDRIEESFRELAARAQVVVVEGVGGFRVPLGAGGDTAQLAARLGLPVVLVVALRLGCLNHALLTADAIAARGLKLAGWIANEIDSGMSAQDENVRTLERLIKAPRIARIGYSTDPQPARVAASLDIRDMLP
jgi:dethiobiotin synthetase